MLFFLKDVFDNDDKKFSKSCMLLNGILVWFDYGNKRKDDVLPSVMEMIMTLPLSYLDVMRAYVELRKMGIITYDKFKGWVIVKSDYLSCMKVLVVLNNQTPFKTTLVEAMAKRFDDKAKLETLVFNNDIDEFKRIVVEKQSEYHKIAVFPPLVDNLPISAELEALVPKGKIFRIDEAMRENFDKMVTIYNSLENNVYDALMEMFSRLASFPLLLLVMEQNTLFAQQFLIGFKRFCNFLSFDYKVVDHISESGLTKGEIFIFTLDKYAAENLFHICQNGWKLNLSRRHCLPSRLRKSNFVVYNGIATFSDDFEEMGFYLADRILD